MRATQLTDFGTDQSPMVTCHSSKIRTKWSTPPDQPRHQRKCFLFHANQLNRGRTLAGVAIRSSSFVGIKYANELPNRTATQFGVLLDVASTTPSSWVVARRILSPILMLMRSPSAGPGRLTQWRGSSETFSGYTGEIRKCVN
jgi:hypothetical protein